MDDNIIIECKNIKEQIIVSNILAAIFELSLTPGLGESNDNYSFLKGDCYIGLYVNDIGFVGYNNDVIRFSQFIYILKNEYPDLLLLIPKHI